MALSSVPFSVASFPPGAPPESLSCALKVAPGRQPALLTASSFPATGCRSVRHLQLGTGTEQLPGVRAYTGTSPAQPSQAFQASQASHLPPWKLLFLEQLLSGGTNCRLQGPR